MDPRFLASLLARADSGAAQLVTDLLARSWPGGAGDRTEPAAREWLLRWAPMRVGAAPRAQKPAPAAAPRLHVPAGPLQRLQLGRPGGEAARTSAVRPSA